MCLSKCSAIKPLSLLNMFFFLFSAIRVIRIIVCAAVFLSFRVFGQKRYDG